MRTKIMSGFFIISMFLIVISVSFAVANDDMQTDQDQNYAENTADDTKSLEEFEEPQEPSWEYESEIKQNEDDNKGSYQQEEMQEYKPEPEENVEEYNYDDNFNEGEVPEKADDKAKKD